MSICFNLVEGQASQQWPIHYSSGRLLDTKKETQERSQRDSSEIKVVENFFPEMAPEFSFPNTDLKKIIKERSKEI